MDQRKKRRIKATMHSVGIFKNAMNLAKQTTRDTIEHVTKLLTNEDDARLVDDDAQFANLRSNLISDKPRTLIPSMNYEQAKPNWKDISESITSPFANVVQDCVHALTTEKEREARLFQIARKTKANGARQTIIAELGNVKKRFNAVERIKQLLKNRTELANILGGPMNARKIEVLRLFIENKEAATALKGKVKSEEIDDEGVIDSPKQKHKTVKPTFISKSYPRRPKSATKFDLEVPEYAQDHPLLRGKSCYCKDCGGKKYYYLYQRRINYVPLPRRNKQPPLRSGSSFLKVPKPQSAASLRKKSISLLSQRNQYIPSKFLAKQDTSSSRISQQSFVSSQFQSQLESSSSSSSSETSVEGYLNRKKRYEKYYARFMKSSNLRSFIQDFLKDEKAEPKKLKMFGLKNHAKSSSNKIEVKIIKESLFRPPKLATSTKKIVEKKKVEEVKYRLPSIKPLSPKLSYKTKHIFTEPKTNPVSPPVEPKVLHRHAISSCISPEPEKWNLNPQVASLLTQRPVYNKKGLFKSKKQQSGVFGSSLCTFSYQ